MLVDEYNDFASLLGRYRTALVQLEKLGIRIPVASRLRSYERRLQQILDDPRPAVEEDLVFALAFDLREIDEIIEIVDFLPVSPGPEVFRLLRQLPGGGDNPDNEDATSAREAQYELYLGTVFRRAGGHLLLGSSVQVEILTDGNDSADSAAFCAHAARAYMAAQAQDA